ncbi:preprotein translocase subunit SecG [Sphingobium sp. Sx8-8]|uniref:preprotein translocase subunit SecG n=1 Tax=Sphingobium sp. Sx8-8 TaxID=2933617 RepID=UPI001F58B629|nr:preprotein translocase subunit SecG [Sphingobium sp. Sx8-8]
MFTFILVVQAIVAALLVTVILMQKSEGGGLGVGGSPAGFMSARGAADFLTRSTTILATIFVSLSIVLAVIASIQHRPSDIDTSLVKQAPATPSTAPAPATGNDPLAGAAGAAGGNAQGTAANGAVPLAN